MLFRSYLGTYQSGGWWDWNGGSGHSAIQSKRGENKDFNYLHRKEFSATIHAEVLDKSLSLDASYFRSKLTNGRLFFKTSPVRPISLSSLSAQAFLHAL